MMQIAKNEPNENILLRQIWSVTDNAGLIAIYGTWTNGEKNENDEAEAEKSYPRYAQNSYALVTRTNCTFSFVLVFAYSCLLCLYFSFASLTSSLPCSGKLLRIRLLALMLLSPRGFGDILSSPFGLFQILMPYSLSDLFNYWTCNVWYCPLLQISPLASEFLDISPFSKTTSVQTFIGHFFFLPVGSHINFRLDEISCY